MGAILTRNRFWWYRSLYDDYVGREMRLAFVILEFFNNFQIFLQIFLIKYNKIFFYLNKLNYNLSILT